jgi:hypothetical protein
LCLLAGPLGGGFEELWREAIAFKRSAFAVTTRKTYRSQLKMYLQFCLEFECQPLPISQRALIAYTAYLAWKLSANSVPGYLTVLRILHLEAGLGNPLENNYELNLIKKGIKREKGVAPVQKKPMTSPILRLMYGFLDLSKPAELSFWAACLISFFGFLRKSTLLPGTDTHLNDKILLCEDVLELCLDSFVLRVKHSKVIQFGEKLHCIPFVLTPEFCLCPVRALMAHFGASPLGAKRPLFNYLFAGREMRLDQAAFVVRLKSCLKSAGVGASGYSAHSFRRGGASYAFEMGVSPLQIKLRGDWASDTFEKYVFISSGATRAVAKTLAGGVKLH